MDNTIKISIARDIAKVRETGLTNMFDRIRVIEILGIMGYEDSVEYLTNYKADYMELLKLSGEY